MDTTKIKMCDEYILFMLFSHVTRKQLFAYAKKTKAQPSCAVTDTLIA